MVRNFRTCRPFAPGAIRFVDQKNEGKQQKGEQNDQIQEPVADLQTSPPQVETEEATPIPEAVVPEEGEVHSIPQLHASSIYGFQKRIHGGMGFCG